MRHVLLICAAGMALILASCAASDKTDPNAVIDQALANYAKMKSYQSEGKAATTLGEKAGGMSMETIFKIKLGRPHLYQISWNGMMNQGGAVWNAGDGPFLYMGMAGMSNAYSKMQSDDMALGAATGVSGGAANTIPSLFFPSPTSGGMLRLMTDLSLKKPEKIDGEECHVITGKSAVSVKHTVWISKTRLILLKHEYSLERPSGAAAFPEMTDEVLDESIKAMGKTPSAEERTKMRDMMESANKMTQDLKGTSVESHSKIVIDADLPKESFAYALPTGAELKDSIF